MSGDKRKDHNEVLESIIEDLVILRQNELHCAHSNYRNRIPESNGNRHFAKAKQYLDKIDFLVGLKEGSGCDEDAEWLKKLIKKGGSS